MYSTGLSRGPGKSGQVEESDAGGYPSPHRWCHGHGSGICRGNGTLEDGGCDASRTDVIRTGKLEQSHLDLYQANQPHGLLVVIYKHLFVKGIATFIVCNQQCALSPARFGPHFGLLPILTSYD